MGGISTKEEIVARLDELDQKELEVNLKLRDLQLELNKLLPEEERLQVNEDLGKEIDDNPKNTSRKKKKKEHKKEDSEEDDD